MVRNVHQQRDERGAKFVRQTVCVALLTHTSKDFESACDEHFDCAPPDSSGGSGYHHTSIGRHLQPFCVGPSSSARPEYIYAWLAGASPARTGDRTGRIFPGLSSAQTCPN